MAEITPFRPKDPTAAERKRRSRAKQRKQRVTTVTVSGAPPVTMRHGAGHGDVAQRVGTAEELGRCSIAVRDAARNAADIEASESGHIARLLRLDEHWPDPDISDDEIPPVPRRVGNPRAGRFAMADMLAYAVAVGLAAVAAWFSLKGLVVLFPGSSREIVVMGAIMEASKLVACGWLAGAWRDVPWAFRGILIILIAGLVVIDGVGTFSQLTSSHVGDRALSAATRMMQATEFDSRIEVAAAKLADVDRRIAAIDSIIAGAAQRGRANTAAAIMADQHKAPASLVVERQAAAEALAAQRVERGGVEARAAIAESAAAPIMYAAEVLGIGADPERAIRWLIALLVCCLDPMALTLTAAVNVRCGRYR
jgi:hypothetical protein